MLVAYGADGDKVEAILLLDEGAPAMVETSHSDLPEPDNSELDAYIIKQTEQLALPAQAGPLDDPMPTLPDI